MLVFVVNAGSSSLKFQLFKMPEEEVLASGGAERIADEGSFIEYKINGQKTKVDLKLKDHTDAINDIVNTLIKNGIIKDQKDIGAVGHRIVHGGNHIYTELVSDQFLSEEKELTDIAPLHTPGAFMGIKACLKFFSCPNYVIFDTAFHQSMPPKAYMYAINYDDYINYKIRKYGFHGMNHAYIWSEANRLYGSKKVISCHLGNGASVAAILDGKCQDTSMGFTPLEGIMMGTRVGDIDPNAVLYLAEKKGMTHREVVNYLSKEAGVKGIFGKTDMRDLEAAMGKDPKADLAADMYCYRVIKYIGAYIAVLQGVDTIVFTAGMGQNAAVFRKMICDNFEYMGLKIDPELNEKYNRKGGLISTPDSTVKVAIIPANEEIVIAREVVDQLNKGNK